jgi:EAL domain-containing protein (putative c-di-GMP-specific phosphodiesterase class I)
MLDHAEIETTLDWLLKHKSIQTCFQPIVSVRKHAVIGLEALSRGLDSNHNIIMPQTLFSTAALAGKSVELDRLCRKTALKNYQRFLEEKGSGFLFLNLDTAIIDQGVVGSGHLIRAVNKLGLSPQSIVIEIIESKVDNTKGLAKFIHSYKEYGFLIALDDMGSDSSNLDRILHARPDIIKIDRGLIKDIHKDYYKQELFKALALVAKKIGALVVAEGVETHAEAITSLQLGADFLQGYFIATPKPYTDIPQQDIAKTMHSLITAYRTAMIENVRSEAVRLSAYENLLKELAHILAHTAPANFEHKLNVIATKHSHVHCYYVLDQNGRQFTETVKAFFNADAKCHGMFRPDFRGSDQSLKDYYIFIHAGAPYYISQPYLSLANGQACVTGSILFESAGHSYILCVDFSK